MRSIALTTNTSILTVVTNDYSFDRVFEKQVEALANEGDILVGISTSGNSINVVNALKFGKRIGTINIGLTGNSGGYNEKVPLFGSIYLCKSHGLGRW
jgi:D-sedoheptulose 7-phosphate isomerase